MCQWFSHFCRRCWVKSVSHPPSSLRGSHSSFPCPYCWLIGGQSAVVQFLQGARIMNPRTVPPWNFTYHTKGPEKASVWTIAILEPQSTLVKSHPAASTGVGQASRRTSFLAVHICKVLQLRCPCLTGQSPYCLNKLSYGFTWPTLFRPLLHLVYPFGHQVSTENSSFPSSLDFIIKKNLLFLNFALFSLNSHRLARICSEQCLEICITSTSYVCLPLYNVMLIVFLNCKSLWIKASAKWINVNVNLRDDTQAIAIGSRATAEPFNSFLVLHEPMDVQFHCVV